MGYFLVLRAAAIIFATTLLLSLVLVFFFLLFINFLESWCRLKADKMLLIVTPLSLLYPIFLIHSNYSSSTALKFIDLEQRILNV